MWGIMCVGLVGSKCNGWFCGWECVWICVFCFVLEGDGWFVVWFYL